MTSTLYNSARISAPTEMHVTSEDVSDGSFATIAAIGIGKPRHMSTQVKSNEVVSLLNQGQNNMHGTSTNDPAQSQLSLSDNRIEEGSANDAISKLSPENDYLEYLTKYRQNENADEASNDDDDFFNDTYPSSNVSSTYPSSNVSSGTVGLGLEQLQPSAPPISSHTSEPSPRDENLKSAEVAVQESARALREIIDKISQCEINDQETEMLNNKGSFDPSVPLNNNKTDVDNEYLPHNSNVLSTTHVLRCTKSPILPSNPQEDIRVEEIEIVGKRRDKSNDEEPGVAYIALAAGKFAAGRERAIRRKIREDREGPLQDTHENNRRASDSPRDYIMTGQQFGNGRRRHSDCDTGLLAALAAAKFSAGREKAIRKKIEEDQLIDEIDSLLDFEYA